MQSINVICEQMRDKLSLVLKSDTTISWTLPFVRFLISRANSGKTPGQSFPGLPFENPARATTMSCFPLCSTK